MDVLYGLVRSVFVLLTFISDDILLLDWWIITPPGSALALRNPNLKWRTRAVAALKTACAYGILEPLFFRWINGLDIRWILWISLLGPLLHIFAMIMAQFVVWRCLKHEIEKHKKFCVPAATALEEKKHELGRGSASPAVLEGARAASAQPSCQHKQTLLVKLAPLLPVITAAATNVGILRYAAYLHGEQSREWFERFAAGWCLLALMVLLCFTWAKWCNRMVEDFCNRHVMIMDQHWTVDLAVRASAWVMLMAIRSAYRFVQARPVLTMVALGRDGLTLSSSTLLGISVLPGPAPDYVDRGGIAGWQPYVVWFSFFINTFNLWFRVVQDRQHAREAEQSD